MGLGFGVLEPWGGFMMGCGWGWKRDANCRKKGTVYKQRQYGGVLIYFLIVDWGGGRGRGDLVPLFGKGEGCPHANKHAFVK